MVAGSEVVSGAEPYVDAGLGRETGTRDATAADGDVVGIVEQVVDVQTEQPIVVHAIAGAEGRGKLRLSVVAHLLHDAELGEVAVRHVTRAISAVGDTEVDVETFGGAVIEAIV